MLGWEWCLGRERFFATYEGLVSADKIPFATSGRGVKVAIPECGELFRRCILIQSLAAAFVNQPGDGRGVFEIADQFSVRIFQKAPLTGKTAYSAGEFRMLNQIFVPDLAVGRC